jgi:hypothetical protein
LFISARSRISAMPSCSKIRAVGGDAVGRRQIVGHALDQIPRLQACHGGRRADYQHRRRGAAIRLSPRGVADHYRHHRGDTVDRQGLQTLAPRQQRGFFEATRLGGHDPEIGLRVVDHGRDHALEAQEHAELNGDQYDGEYDANDGCD